MKGIKFIIPVAFLLICALLVIGCNSKTSTTTTTTSAKTTTTSTSAPASSTTTSTSTSATTTKPIVTTTTTAAPTSAVQTGGILRLAFTADAASLGLPSSMQGTPDQISCRPVIEPLFRLGNDGSIVPWLAESLKADPVAKTYTITLKKGIMFHDGTPFNAAAVKWNLETFKATPAGGGTYAYMTNVDVIDEYTARLNLTQWDNTLISNMALSPPGYIISPTAYQKNGADWCKVNPVGTGPFTFVSWQRDVKKVFKKNDNYWIKGQPYLDGVEIYVIADPTTEAASLLKGDIDIIVSSTIQNAVSLQSQGFNLSKCPLGGGLRSMVGDSAHPDSPFAKLQVRQAISYAIDVPAIASSVWKGFMPVTNQFALPGTVYYSKDVVGYPYNPAKAKQLLAEAGYGSGLKTTLYVNNDQNQINQYTAVQGYFADVGINAQLQVMDSGKYVAMQMTDGWSNGIYCLGSLLPADPLAISASMFSATATSVVGKNIAKFSDLDKVIADSTSATDDATKAKNMQQMQVLINDKYCLFTPTIINVDLAPKNKKVHGDGVDDKPFGLWTPESAWISK
jgi:peptide/nickel transport system substrate-binding protein